MNTKLSFASDYMEGAHPSILETLQETNFLASPGYGTDSFTESAKQKIREACKAPDAEVYFLVGGTQTNATVIDGLLQSYQGVIAADTGHVSMHEAGAIEHSGHKVLTLPHELGKLSAEEIRAYLKTFWSDENHEHMVMPGMVYISQPTEYGTLYSKKELEDISSVCREYQIPLYVDGARLAYALASPANDVSLQDLAGLCDVFYIGGTKCGALFGEAVVIPKAGQIPHFFTIIKQHGALLAKGRILGIQFDVLFTDHLYEQIGKTAVALAAKIQDTIKTAGIPLYLESPTNQVFCIMENSRLEALGNEVEYSFWEKADETHTVIRFATSWATQEENVEKLCELLRRE